MSNFIPFPMFYDDVPIDISFIFEDEKENVVKSKKTYTEPELRFIVIQAVDIITTSPNDGEWEDDNVKDDGWL